MTTTVDRAALVRRAMVDLVAERGLHGTSMSQVAQRAGVGTGTAYVYYESKEDLLIAAFVEVKSRLGGLATSGVDLAGPPEEVFEGIWRRVYSTLRNDPEMARFLIQVEVSPLRKRAHEALVDDDPLSSAAEVISDHLVDLPGEVLYDLALAPAVRLAASDEELTPEELERVVSACWRAIKK